jgi:hypothetical protein
MRRNGLIAGALLAATMALPVPATAEVIVGVSEGAPQLVAFDSAAPGVLVNRPQSVSAAPVPITGLGAGETIVGIDYRPANGRLYAVTKDAANDGRLYTLNEVNGVASPVGAATFPLGAGTSYGVDFNPVVDRLRIVSNIPSPDPNAHPPAQVGNNIRVQPDNGSLVATDDSLGYPPLDPNDATNPGIVAIAYTNNFAGAPDTTLFGWDNTPLNELRYVRQGGVGGTPSPNTGVLTRTGGFFIGGTDGRAGYDIAASGTGFVSAGTITAALLVAPDPTTLTVLNFAGNIGPDPAIRYSHISAVPAGVISVRDVTVDEAAGTATITVDRERGSLGTVQVDATTADGSALAGQDYGATLAAPVFGNGQTKETFTVPITQDPDDEPPESFNVTIGNPTNGAVIIDPSGVVTITDDDPAPSPLTISDVAVTEGGLVTLTVSRSSGDAAAASVDYATAPGSADAADFTPTNGTLDIPAGQNSASFTIQTTADNKAEGDESFTVTLSNATGPASIADASGAVTILDAPVELLDGPCANEQTGSEGPDALIGSDAGDNLIGLGGADQLTGEGGEDCLEGGGGADDVGGGAGDDRLIGGPGRDELSGSSGDDRVNARGGGSDKVRCGKGDDRVRADSGDDVAGNCERVRLRRG